MIHLYSSAYLLLGHRLQCTSPFGSSRRCWVYGNAFIFPIYLQHHALIFSSKFERRLKYGFKLSNTFQTSHNVSLKVRGLLFFYSFFQTSRPTAAFLSHTAKLAAVSCPSHNNILQEQGFFLATFCSSERMACSSVYSMVITPNYGVISFYIIRLQEDGRVSGLPKLCKQRLQQTVILIINFQLVNYYYLSFLYRSICFLSHLSLSCITACERMHGFVWFICTTCNNISSNINFVSFVHCH